MSDGPRLSENFFILSTDSAILSLLEEGSSPLTCSTIEMISKTINNYCIYIPSNNPEHCIQLNLIANNMKKKYQDINFYFITSKDMINNLKLSDNFIDIEFFNKNKNQFGCIEQLEINPKADPVEEFCKKNEIELCVDNDYPNSLGNKIIIFTKSNNCKKSLLDIDLDKIKRIFGNNLIIDPDNFENAKYVIGPECWQIFYSASKKIPTYVITNNGNYAGLFLKMFPKQKKIDL